MIPRNSLNVFTKGINGISERSQKSLADALAQIDYNAARWVDAVIEVMQTICGASADVTAVLAAEYYDYVRTLQVGEPLGADADSGRVPIATEKAVRGIVQKGVDGNYQAMEELLFQRVDYEIKRAAADTVYINGSKDKLKPKFARVPSGFETCQFCMMLASRGFVYSTDKTAGSIDHYHAHCDCRIVPGFNALTEVEGYDTNAIYAHWKASIEDEARQREEKSGNTVEQERSAIMRRYSESAKRAKNRARTI